MSKIVGNIGTEDVFYMQELARQASEIERLTEALEVQKYKNKKQEQYIKILEHTGGKE